MQYTKQYGSHQYAEFKKPDTKEYILCESIYIKFKRRKNYSMSCWLLLRKGGYITGKGLKDASEVMAIFYFLL